MKQCGFCELKKVCERKLGQHGMPPCAANTGGTQPTDTQQLKAEIRAICIELECTSHDKFDCGMYHALRGRLRELSAI